MKGYPLALMKRTYSWSNLGLAFLTQNFKKIDRVSSFSQNVSGNRDLGINKISWSIGFVKNVKHTHTHTHTHTHKQTHTHTPIKIFPIIIGILRSAFHCFVPSDKDWVILNVNCLYIFYSCQEYIVTVLIYWAYQKYVLC